MRETACDSFEVGVEANSTLKSSTQIERQWLLLEKS
jgi:hypothetical protein